MKNKIMQCITAASLSFAMLVSPTLTNGIAAEEEAPHYYINYYRDAQKSRRSISRR